MNDNTNQTQDPNAPSGQISTSANVAAGAVNSAATINSANAATDTNVIEPKEDTAASTAGQSTQQSASPASAPTVAAASSLVVTSGVDKPEASTQDQIDAVANEVAATVAATPVSNTSAEKDLLGALKGYRLAAETRFKELLTGMANSTAEALRCLAEAEIHLADHIQQVEGSPAPAVKVEA